MGKLEYEAPVLELCGRLEDITEGARAVVSGGGGSIPAPP